MSERYIITGVQLGMLIAIKDPEKRKEIVDEIIDKQFLGRKQDIDKIVKEARDVCNEIERWFFV